MVPVEYLGKARAFRSALVADHDAAIVMAARLTQPFLTRYRLRQPPTAGALDGLAKGWRDRMPKLNTLPKAEGAALANADRLRIPQAP